jgi:hypothetical protein
LGNHEETKSTKKKKKKKKEEGRGCAGIAAHPLLFALFVSSW